MDAAEEVVPLERALATLRSRLTDLESKLHDSGEAPTFATLGDLLERPELLAPPECVVPRLGYRGRLVVLAGPDKSGKSTLMGHAIAAVSRRGRFLDGRTHTQQGRALLVGLEEAVGDAVRRLSEARADPRRVSLVVAPRRDLLTRIEALLSEWTSDLVVVDSLQEYARVTLGAVPDDGDSSGWASVVRPLAGLARTRDVALVVLHHVRRSDGQYRGSSEIAAAADALLELSPPKPGEDPTVRRIRGRGRWAIEPFEVALREGTYQLAGGAELSVDARVLLFIESNPGASKNAIRTGVGGRGKTVDSAVDRLLARGALEDRATGRGSALYLPSGQLSAGDL